MFDFINIPDELERLFTLNASIHSYETHFSQISHISKSRNRAVEKGRGQGVTWGRGGSRQTKQ